MVKAKIKFPDGFPENPGKDSTVYLVGLSADNIMRLIKHDDPIMFNMTELGFPEGTGHVVIVYGKTEQEIQERLFSFAPKAH